MTEIKKNWLGRAKIIKMLKMFLEKKTIKGSPGRERRWICDVKGTQIK